MESEACRYIERCPVQCKECESRQHGKDCVTLLLSAYNGLRTDRHRVSATEREFVCRENCIKKMVNHNPDCRMCPLDKI